jgi:spore coat protein A
VVLSRRKLLRGATHAGVGLAAAGYAWGVPVPPQLLCTSAGLRKVVSRLPQPSMVPMLHPDTLARFVDRLPIPEAARSTGIRADPDHPAKQLPYFRLAMRECEVRIHRDLPPTRCWGYGSAMPGPTFDVRSGQPLLIEWANELPQKHFLPIDHSLHGAGKDLPEVRTVVHVHGARVPAHSDGYPENWYATGKSATYRYPNRQAAATLWYHDHTMGIERLNVYAGLLGAYLIRDELEHSLRLPAGEFELPLIIFDRRITKAGQLDYPTSGLIDTPWVSEAYGDAILVNGALAPYLEVEPRRYRFRVVNASNARFYYLALSDGSPLVQIGSDQGLLLRPAILPSVTLAPAERADIIIDFGPLAGRTILLQSQALQLMQFRVASRALAVQTPLPGKLAPVERIARSTAVRTRTLTLDSYEDPATHMMMMLLNATYWHQPVTEKPTLDSVEIWELVNPTEDTHPIHLHLVRFQVLERQRFDVDEYLVSGKLKLDGAVIAPPENEMGWKDTVQAHAGLITRIIVRFEGYPGRYVWHCHVLEHSANEMMRPFDVIAHGASA